MTKVTVDFVAFDDERNAVLLVFVEEGWSADVDAHLRSLQERFFTAMEAALDGDLADKFPKSVGRNLVIQVDCYDLPSQPIDEFVARFAEGIRNLPDFSTADSPYIRSIDFEVRHEAIRREG